MKKNRLLLMNEEQIITIFFIDDLVKLSYKSFFTNTEISYNYLYQIIIINNNNYYKKKFFFCYFQIVIEFFGSQKNHFTVYFINYFNHNNNNYNNFCF